MYNISYFKEEDKLEIIAFMKQHPFAVITGMGEEFPLATQIPLELEEKEGKLFLCGHLMKKTDHHLAFEKNPNVLVLFTGPHCYVSASWYNNPQTASTWNYMTVHAKGKISFSDEDGTYEAVKAVTNKYEGVETKAAFNNMPQEYVKPLLKAIVGFSIEIEMLDNVFKLSQNKKYEEQINIIEQLRSRNNNDDDLQIASEIEKRLQ
jgi:transcriptional regulator